MYEVFVERESWKAVEDAVEKAIDAAVKQFLNEDAVMLAPGLFASTPPKSMLNIELAHYDNYDTLKEWSLHDEVVRLLNDEDYVSRNQENVRSLSKELKELAAIIDEKLD